MGEHLLINFEKRRKMASVISRLQQVITTVSFQLPERMEVVLTMVGVDGDRQCQRTPFGFHVVPQIYSILLHEIAKIDPAEIDDNHLYQLSLQREPKEKKNT